MKYLNLIFSKTKLGEYKDNHINHYDSTTSYKVDSSYYDTLTNDDVYTLKYELRENSTVDKWVNHFLSTEETLMAKNGVKSWQYNFYTFPSWEAVKEGRVKMNKIIDTLNSKNWASIPDTLKLLEDDKSVVELDKLNELHFIFESEIIKLDGENTNPELFFLLEGVNNLVHLCEKYDPVNETSTEYHSYRLDEDIMEYVLHMEDTDYENMDINLFGTVTLDFGTVGKDLGACFYTQDIELVKRQEIKQQEYIKANISFDWTSKENDPNEEYRRYYKWCEDNNVQDYGYNYKEPKYNLGRVILGDLINKDSFTSNDIQNILLEYPYFYDIILSQD